MVARENDFDVIVLGAGPAGCGAAILGAQNDLKIALLERQAFPRHRPGETLHPGIEPLLRQLGVDSALHSAGFLRHPGNWVRWPDELRFEPFGADHTGQWLGFQAWRSSFDALLLERVKQLGVEVRQPCRILEPLRDAARVIGVRTADFALRARFVIDATGASHWLARRLALQIKRYSPRLIARFGYVKGNCEVRDDAPAIIANDVGWSWTARVQPQIYQWTNLSWRTHKEDSCVPNELRGLDPHGPVRTTDVTWRMVTEPAGPGYFLAGDAAAVLDPASSHGVLRAVMSGMMAAHLSSKVVKDNVSESLSTQTYRQWLTGWFENDVARLREMYGQLPGCDWLLRDNFD
jgi:flavin-dependent dehydrogenase